MFKIQYKTGSLLFLEKQRMRSTTVLLAFIGIFFIIGCGGTESSEETGRIHTTTETIKLEGLKCQMCVATVQRAAGNLDGVEHMRIDFDAQVATVSFNSDLVSLTDIEHAIAESGYHANDTRRNEDAYANLPDCCR
jgi:copper ion binding protein